MTNATFYKNVDNQWQQLGILTLEENQAPTTTGDLSWIDYNQVFETPTRQLITFNENPLEWLQALKSSLEANGDMRVDIDRTRVSAAYVTDTAPATRSNAPYILGAFLFLLLLGAIGFYFVSKDDEKNKRDNTPAQTEPRSTPKSTPKTTPKAPSSDNTNGSDSDSNSDSGSNDSGSNGSGSNDSGSNSDSGSNDSGSNESTPPTKPDTSTPAPAPKPNLLATESDLRSVLPAAIEYSQDYENGFDSPENLVSYLKTQLPDFTFKTGTASKPKADKKTIFVEEATAEGDLTLASVGVNGVRNQLEVPFGEEPAFTSSK